MRYIKPIFLAALIAIAPAAKAWEYYSSDGYPAKSTEHSVQLRTGADFTKKFNHGLKLHFGEDLRFDLYNTAANARFNKSYTTLSLSYSPITYFKVDAGYTLKIMGTKDWSDVNEWMRHRVFVSATGSYKVDNWKFSLRERLMLEMRTDSVNPLEKNKNDLLLRSKLGVEYTIRTAPVKPYAWVEVVNTLNAPEYQQKYKDNNSANGGHQFIKRVRTEAGVKWKLDRNNTLNFYYRFNYGYDRDINIKRKDTSVIRLTEEYSYQHAIGIAYEFGW